MVGYSILRIRKLLFWSNGWLYSKIICICPTILLRCSGTIIMPWFVIPEVSQISTGHIQFSLVDDH